MPKYKLQEMYDVRQTGERRVYPKLDAYRLLDAEEFIEKMHSYDRAISPSVIRAVLMNLSDTLKRMLSLGYTVKVDELGTFSLSLDFDDDKPKVMQQADDKMAYRHVMVKNVNFKVDPSLLKDLRYETELEREMSGVKVIKKQLFTLEQRIERALAVIERDGFIRLTDYAAINNLSRTSASQELKQICADPDGSLEAKGRGSHKVWVKKIRLG
ncbi:MAG: hypothetical protein SO287_00640 [Parabacteroides sp.]|nr:hypothetical protein [bacterium]MDY4756107.1 hypothetical protein [Parabacteroides sp.]